MISSDMDGIVGWELIAKKEITFEPGDYLSDSESKELRLSALKEQREKILGNQNLAQIEAEIKELEDSQ
jgi:hypothetical protein